MTGYSPSPNRYYVRLTAPVGRVQTTNWNEQKAKVTGYTQPSNQYFATRARLAYHPPDKTFGSFSGTNMSVEGITQSQQTTAKKEAPPKPAEVQQNPPPSNTTQKSKKEQLEEYEAEYLQRMEQTEREVEKQMTEAQTAEKETTKPRGTLPKGFVPKPKPEPEPEPEPSKKPKGTLPKGF